MKKLIALLLCAILLVGVIPSAVFAADTTAPTASITAVSGTVRVKRGNSEKDISAFIGMKIKKDDTITTGAKGAITIDIGDDKVIKAAANSSFSITHLANKSGVAAVGFTLIYGTVFNAVNKAQSSDDNYTVQAGNTVMGVRGTQFTVTYFVENGVAKYRIVTMDGTVYTRVLKPQTMDDNNNILDIEEGMDVGRGQSISTSTEPKEIPLDELSRDELELILEIEDLPEEIKKEIEDIIETLPPVKDEETTPPSKVVYEEEQPVPTPGGGSTSGQSSTPPPPSSPPSPALDISTSLFSAFAAALSANVSTTIPLNASTFGGHPGPYGIGTATILNATSLTAPITIMVDGDLTIGSGGSLVVTNDPGGLVTIKVNATKTVDVNGTLTATVLVNNGTINNNSNTINIQNNGSFIVEAGASLVNGADFVINISDSSGLYNRGTITNHGEINVDNSSTIDNQSSASITNDGILNITDSSNFFNRNGAIFTSTGAIKISESILTLELSSTTLLSGTVTVSEEASYFLSNGHLAITGNTTFNHNGTGYCSDGTFLVFNDFVFNGAHTVTFNIDRRTGFAAMGIHFLADYVAGFTGSSMMFHYDAATTLLDDNFVLDGDDFTTFWNADGSSATHPTEGMAAGGSNSYVYSDSKWKTTDLTMPIYTPIP